jgi:4-hydroxy-4-methyl-2-oxoglutarate aldolase
MKPSIFKQTPRSPEDQFIIQSLMELGVATIAEAQEKTGLLEPSIRPLQQGVRVSGTAVTVKCFDGDNLMIHASLEVVKQGDVIMLTTYSGNSMHGMFGELLALACKSRGVKGLITDSGVRDVKSIREMGFPVWCKFITALGTSKNRPGWVNIPITIGGVLVRPGDYVVADDDGVVIVPRENAKDVIVRAKMRAEKEEEIRRRILSGELTLDIYGFRDTIRSLGIEYS